MLGAARRVGRDQGALPGSVEGLPRRRPRRSWPRASWPQRKHELAYHQHRCRRRGPSRRRSQSGEGAGEGGRARPPPRLLEAAGHAGAGGACSGGKGEADEVDAAADELIRAAGLTPAGKARLRDGRTGQEFEGDVTVGIDLHAEAEPPGGRQDPRPLDRPVLAGHAAAARRQGAVRRPAVRRNGSVGARGVRRRPRAAGDAHGQVATT